MAVLKPGAFGLVASSTRNQHIMATNLANAGFQVRDIICWHYGTGFPKNRDIGQEMQDKAEADTAAHYAGMVTSLKPATEMWSLVQKPFDGTYCNNLGEHGVGGLHIDSCRIDFQGGEDKSIDFNRVPYWTKGKQPFGRRTGIGDGTTVYKRGGRWPANMAHDGSPPIIQMLPDDVARFFYCPKASVEDRDAGVSGEPQRTTDGRQTSYKPAANKYGAVTGEKRNTHPTVKPTPLMQWLCRLITPKAGLVLDPYCGSGSTGKACAIEGFGFVGLEREPDYCRIARERIAAMDPLGAFNAKA